LTPLLIPTLIVLPSLSLMIAVISAFPQPQSKDTSKRQDKGKSCEHKYPFHIGLLTESVATIPDSVSAEGRIVINIYFESNPCFGPPFSRSLEVEKVSPEGSLLQDDWKVI
jgi:hypothetical protein